MSRASFENEIVTGIGMGHGSGEMSHRRKFILSDKYKAILGK